MNKFQLFNKSYHISLAIKYCWHEYINCRWTHMRLTAVVTHFQWFFWMSILGARPTELLRTQIQTPHELKPDLDLSLKLMVSYSSNCYLSQSTVTAAWAGRKTGLQFRTEKNDTLYVLQTFVRVRLWDIQGITLHCKGLHRASKSEVCAPHSTWYRTDSSITFNERNLGRVHVYTWNNVPVWPKRKLSDNSATADTCGSLLLRLSMGNISTKWATL